MFNELRIKNQLYLLRQKWLKEPDNRSIIERQGRALKLALADLRGVEKSADEVAEVAQQIFQ